MNGKKIAILCASIVLCAALVLGIIYINGGFQPAKVAPEKQSTSSKTTAVKTTKATEKTTEEENSTEAETTESATEAQTTAATTAAPATTTTTAASKSKTTTTTVKSETFTSTTTTTKAKSSASFLSIEQEMLNSVNAERVKVGLSALTLNSTVNACARTRALELLEKMDHTRPDGSVFYSVLPKGSYNTAGENIAAGYGYGNGYGVAGKGSVMEGWMNSPGHKANILKPEFTQLGCACAYVADDPNGYYYYWVQIFIG